MKPSSSVCGKCTQSINTNWLLGEMEAMGTQPSSRGLSSNKGVHVIILPAVVTFVSSIGLWCTNQGSMQKGFLLCFRGNKKQCLT